MELSIVVPVYNVEKYLEECLNSINEIKNIDYELIIVNDGSLDNSQKIIEEFCKRNKRAKYYIKENGGLSSARNYGLERAVGEYIWFIDSDDFIDAQEFMRLFKEIKEEDIIMFNYYKKMGEKIEKVSKIKEESFLCGEEFLRKNQKKYLDETYVWKNIYKNSFLKNNNLYFEKGIILEDQLFGIKSLLCAEKVKKNNKHIYYYRKDRNGSITTSPNKKLFAESSYIICLKLLEDKVKINTFYYIKQIIFSHYMSYIKYFKKRDYELEKELWSLKGMFFVKLEKKYKLWRFFKKERKI